MEISMTFGKTNAGESVFTGFQYIWLRYVHGFSPSRHCQSSLLGKNDQRFKNKMEIDQSYLLDKPEKARYIYLCGEASIPDCGLHLALEPAEGACAELTTYNGIPIVVKNARMLPIPALPEGFAGKPYDYTSCVNWQFGVEYFGLT